MSIMTYIDESLSELRHIRWPTRQQAVRLTSIVIVFIAINAVAFGFLDYLLSQVTAFLLNFSY